MEASDLRIGNFVTIVTKNPKKETPLFTDEIHEIDSNDFYYFDDEAYTPISLTEEWLFRFGAELDRGIFRLSPMKGYFCLLNLKGDLFYEYNINNVQIIKIKYVHQLQNLYFTLTGTELAQKTNYHGQKQN